MRFALLYQLEGMFQMKNPPVRLLPFFILTENSDLATEYEYRHEGVNDYITAPVNIPELIRRVLFFKLRGDSLSATAPFGYKMQL